jgi:outer membrane biosynthesis protein TonB
MSYSSRSTLIAALLLFWLQQLIAVAGDTKAPAPDPELAAADQLFRAGKFGEAEVSYQALLKKNPKLVSARVGLVRSMLREQKIDEAWDAVNGTFIKDAGILVDLGVQPDSAGLLAVKGDVQFRLGKISDAEESYLAAKKLDPKEVRTYLGLARLYASSSLYRQAYDQLQIAHEIAADAIEVQRAWLGMLPRKERLAALEAYLAGPHPDDEEETMQMEEALEFLKATIDKPVHACKLASKVEQTDTNLETMYTPNGRMRGIGLSVKLNDQQVRLLLDTGAGGIMVSHKIAESAGLTRISSRHYGGIGDKGLQSGYTAVADHIRVGDLEFQDCVVSVIDKDSVVDQDGVIGANVFMAYLVDLYLPGMRLKLSPLPKRPEDTVAPKSLNSEGEEQATAEQKQESVTGQASKQPKSSAPTSTPIQHLPRDRYIAPEMTYWTKIFRIGHLVLLPTSVNFSEPMLFELDTGGVVNILSMHAERQVSKLSSGTLVPIQGWGLRGLSGEVDKAYFTKATVSFAHFGQWSTGVVSLDLSNLSRRAGTEVSGLLGFDLLRLLEVKLDYRDGLVDFVYNPARVQPVAQSSPPATGQKPESPAGTTSQQTQGPTMPQRSRGTGIPITSLGVVVALREDNTGAQITEVAPHSVAELGGLHPDDTINAVNGMRIKTPMELVNALSGMAPGTKVRLGCLIRGQWQSETTLILWGIAQTTETKRLQRPQPNFSATPAPNPCRSEAVDQAEILTDTMGVDFGSYVTQIVKIIRQNSINIMPLSLYPVSKEGKVSIEFVILKDGKTSGMVVHTSSGDVALDRGMLESITVSTPFSPLPTEFPGQTLRLRLNHFYNLGISASPISIYPCGDVQVPAGSTLQFSASGKGITDASMTWSVSGHGCSKSGCGTISDAGLYTAPVDIPDPPMVVVEATSRSDTSVTAKSIKVSVVQTPPQGGSRIPNFNSSTTSGSAVEQAAAANRGGYGGHGQAGEFGSPCGSRALDQAEILTDTMGVDFGPYLTQVVKIVKQNWYNLMPPSVYPPILKQGKLSIEFVVSKDGKVSGMVVHTSSGDVALDRAAWMSIKASTFPPLPFLPRTPLLSKLATVVSFWGLSPGEENATSI